MPAIISWKSASAVVKRPLQAGMALTVEPGIYIPKDATDVDEKWRGIGVRIETWCW